MEIEVNVFAFALPTLSGHLHAPTVVVASQIESNFGLENILIVATRC